MVKKKGKYITAVVGATGAVGNEMINTLGERAFPIERLRLFASERCDEQVGQEIIAASLRQSDGALESSAQLEALTKTLNEHQTAEGRQVGFVERKTQCLQPFWHHRTGEIASFSAGTQTYLKGRKVSKGLNPPFASIWRAFPASPPCQFMHF